MDTKGEALKSTIYLFGESKMQFEPCLTEFATKRIEAGERLLKELAEYKNEKDIPRYQAVEKAIKFYRELLEEE